MVVNAASGLFDTVDVNPADALVRVGVEGIGDGKMMPLVLLGDEAGNPVATCGSCLRVVFDLGAGSKTCRKRVARAAFKQHLPPSYRFLASRTRRKWNTQPVRR